MASLVTGTLCRQARSIGRLHTLNHNHFASQSNLIQLCLRNFATKKMGLPRVFFDMAIDNEPAGRFIVEVCTIFNKNMKKKINSNFDCIISNVREKTPIFFQHVRLPEFGTIFFLFHSTLYIADAAKKMCFLSKLFDCV